LITLGLLFTIVGIAFVDSLNPSLFVAQFYLLTTPKPSARVMSYVAGILLVNFLGGILILSGARVVIGEFFASLDLRVLYGVQLVVGIALLVFGLWMRIHHAALDSADQSPEPRSLRSIHTFIFGGVVMLNEITTALPYFVAIERIVEAQLSSVSVLLALVIYNAVFSLPLFGFLGLFLLYRERFAAQLDRISQWVHLVTRRVMKYGALALGGGLALNAVAFLITGTALFAGG
jgi:cytochrome c biogenesis protein CcdA